MTIKRFNVDCSEIDSYPFEFESETGPYIRLEDIVKYLHEQIHISDTNRKGFDEECKSLAPNSHTFKWQMVESMKCEAEMNAFIIVLQALGKNPIKETK